MAERPPAQPSARETQARADSDAGGRLAALAAPGLVLLALICCAGPLLAAALVASGAGTWLAAHGYLLAAVALFAIAAAVTWLVLARLSRQA